MNRAHVRTYPGLYVKYVHELTRCVSRTSFVPEFEEVVF